MPEEITVEVGDTDVIVRETEDGFEVEEASSDSEAVEEVRQAVEDVFGATDSAVVDADEVRRKDGVDLTSRLDVVAAVETSTNVQYSDMARLDEPLDGVQYVDSGNTKTDSIGRGAGDGIVSALVEQGEILRHPSRDEEHTYLVLCY